MSELIELELHASGMAKIQVSRAPYERAKRLGRVGPFVDQHYGPIDTDVEVHEPDGTVVDVETGAIFPPSEPVFLLWSLVDRQWWKTPGTGWTADVWQAARFNVDHAQQYGSGRQVLIVLAPESGRDHRFGVDELAGVYDLMERRIADADLASKES
jgi:hypothetical protein